MKAVIPHSEEPNCERSLHRRNDCGQGGLRPSVMARKESAACELRHLQHSLSQPNKVVLWLRSGSVWRARTFNTFAGPIPHLDSVQRASGLSNDKERKNARMWLR